MVSPECELADDVQIGPYCIITGRVTLRAGCRLISHVQIQGPALIGAGALLYPFACVGFEPQDVKFRPGHPSAGVVLGTNATLREHATIHASTKIDVPTRVGESIFMLVNAHIGHDSQVGNNVVMVNNSCFGGHAQIGDNVLMGGGSVVHQFVRVGRFAHFGGLAGASQDVPPFCVCHTINRIGGINRVGLRRAGFPRDHITAVMQAYAQVIKHPMDNETAINRLRELALETACPLVDELADFIVGTKRGIAAGMGKPPREAGAWFRSAVRTASGLTVPASEPQED